MVARRRNFLKKSLCAIPIIALGSCHMTNPNADKSNVSMTELKPDLFFGISLAQWSLNRAFYANKLSPEEFAVIAREKFDLNAIEYVNDFYRDDADKMSFWEDMKRRAGDVGVKSLLIMIDDEGSLGDSDDQKRKNAVENHYKWIDAASVLGCHSVRVNAFGEGSREKVANALVDGLGRLVSYAGKQNINVLIENHGMYSSDANWVVGIVNDVDRKNCGTLPDFGNWCLTEEWGSLQNKDCAEIYDPYEGVRQLLPYAHGVSAKSYDFDENGQETSIDYVQMLQAVYDAGFRGYIGIEYEGERLSEVEGILATKKLLMEAGEKVVREIL